MTLDEATAITLADEQLLCHVATPITGAICVQNFYEFEGEAFIEVKCPGPYHYDSYVALPQVVRYRHREYVRSCFDSDRSLAFYRTNAQFAVAV